MNTIPWPSRALARDDQPADAHPPCRARASPDRGWSTASAGQPVAQQRQRMRARGQPGRGVVGEHRLPRRQRSQRGRRRQVERQRQLRAAGHASPPGVATPSCHSAIRARRAGGRLGASASHAPDQAAARATAAPAPAREARSDELRNAPAGLAGRDERLDLLLAHAADVAEPDPDATTRHARRRRLDRMSHSTPLSLTSGAQHLDPPPLRLVDQRVGRVEAHRLLVEQRAQELRARSGRAATSTGRRAGRRRRRAPWESRSRRSPGPSRTPARPVSSSTPCMRLAPATKRSVVGLDRRLRALAAHRPPQPLGLARREAGERDRDLEHLVLEDDRAERLAQHRLAATGARRGPRSRGPRAAAGGARCTG